MRDDFSPRTADLLDRAAAICAGRGAKLTELRRDVLGLILDAGQPTGAYDLLDRLRARRSCTAPPTVYRALDFLLQHGLIHRVERLSAFVGCVAPGPGHAAGHEAHPDAAGEAGAHAHAAQFLICRRCGRVTEIEDPGLAEALSRAAAAAGFSVRTATVEAEGICAACASGAEAQGGGA